jgi:hypothetical protein
MLLENVPFEVTVVLSVTKIKGDYWFLAEQDDPTDLGIVLIPTTPSICTTNPTQFEDFVKEFAVELSTQAEADELLVLDGSEGE